MKVKLSEFWRNSSSTLVVLQQQGSLERIMDRSSSCLAVASLKLVYTVLVCWLDE